MPSAKTKVTSASIPPCWTYNPVGGDAVSAYSSCVLGKLDEAELSRGGRGRLDEAELLLICACSSGWIERGKLDKAEPLQNLIDASLMKRSPYKDVPWPSFVNTSLMKRSPYKDVPWPSSHGLPDGAGSQTVKRARGTLGKAEPLQRHAKTIRGWQGREGMLRRAYVPCHCLKRSRRGSWGNGPAINQVQWRNAVEN